MKIAIYSRKSKFTGKGESIENQIELCRDYISKNIYGVKNEDILVYEDEGFSGKNMDRPQFQQMMSSAKVQKFDYIVCYRLDRISRNVGDFANLIDELKVKDTAFICIKEQFDTSSPMGRAMMYIASVFAQLERETIAERIRDNMYLLSRTGRWLGGMTPLGFRSEKVESVTVDGKTRSAFKLIPVAEEMSLVGFIFSKFIEASSIGAVTRYLIQNDIKTRTGKDFTNVAVKNILHNPVYCIADEAAYEFFYEKGSSLAFEKSECTGKHGFMPYNRTNHVGKQQTKNEICDWMLAIGKHSGTIKSADYIKANALLLAKKTKSREAMRSPHTSPALLSGLLKCGRCDHFMRPHLHSNRKYEDGRIPFFYICEHKEHSSRIKCQMKNVDGHVIDKVVCDTLLGFDRENSPIAQSLEGLTAKITKLKAEESGNAGFMENQLGTKRTMIKNLITTLAKGGSDDYATELIKEQINELHEQCKELEMQLAKAAVSTSEYEDCHAQVAAVKQALDSFRGTFETSSNVEKRELICEVIDRIIWDGENAHIFLVGE